MNERYILSKILNYFEQYEYFIFHMIISHSQNNIFNNGIFVITNKQCIYYL